MCPSEDGSEKILELDFETTKNKAGVCDLFGALRAASWYRSNVVHVVNKFEALVRPVVGGRKRQSGAVSSAS